MSDHETPIPRQPNTAAGGSEPIEDEHEAVRGTDRDQELEREGAATSHDRGSGEAVRGQSSRGGRVNRRDGIDER